MAQSEISFFIDDAAVSARTAEVPNAIWNSGMFGGASNAPGIGISTENPNLEQSLMPATNGGSPSTGSWTLLDQGEAANGFTPRVRDAQRSQNIGGSGYTDRVGAGEVPWPSSGGEEGSLPANTARLLAAADLPTYADKLADPNVDGQLSFPADGASLVDLAIGWADLIPPP
jgi:hypothetical protein